MFGRLGHGGAQDESVPRLVEVGGEEGDWCDGSFWSQQCGPRRGSSSPSDMGSMRLGHGGMETELVRQLIEALIGKKLIGASAGDFHPPQRELRT